MRLLAKFYDKRRFKFFQYDGCVSLRYQIAWRLDKPLPKDVNVSILKLEEDHSRGLSFETTFTVYIVVFIVAHYLVEKDYVFSITLRVWFQNASQRRFLHGFSVLAYNSLGTIYYNNS